MTDELFSAPARVTSVRTVDQLRAAGDDTADGLLELARERALNAEAFDRYPPVFFTVNASTNVRDAYSTIMGDSSLTNFAADAAEGRNVLDSHNSRENGFGKSLTGAVVSEGDTKLTRSSFFTISGYQHKGFHTDSLIAAIETGMHSDISVGFTLPAGESSMTCSICGGNMLSWDECPHFAGFMYDIETDGGMESRLAVGTIEGARLNEYSLVYDGATPGAAVVKALRAIEGGMVDRATVDQLSRVYHRAFPMPNQSWAIGATSTNRGSIVAPYGKGGNMGTELTTDLRTRIISLAAERGVTIRNLSTDEDIERELKALLERIDGDRVTAETELATARQQIESDASLVEDGKQYRASVVEAALDAQVRSLPADRAATYNRDVHKRYFESMDIADVLALTDTYNAASQFEPGQQHSPQGTPTPPVKRRRVPGIVVHRDN